MGTEPPPEPRNLGLFEAWGVEIEYMLVRSDTLDVFPAADRVLEIAAGSPAGDVERGRIAWSNELVLHVIELKTNGPAEALEGLAPRFQGSVDEIDRILAPLGGRLLPTAAHPWMDPTAESRIWPHEYSAVYEAFDRIFGCRGHGWSNLQSMHLNLPFDGEEEFVRLHAAIRMVLPIIPGLAASSPFLDGRPTGLLDSRLEAYRRNSARIPSITGSVVPEAVESISEYHERILDRIYRDLAPHDPAGVLHDEWANARGAIARFQRNAIEIRVIDAQECPAADLAVAALVSRAVRALVEDRWRPLRNLLRWPVEPLASMLLEGIRDGEEAAVPPEYAACFGGDGRRIRVVRDLWRHLRDSLLPEDHEALPAVDRIVEEGPLARRLLLAAGPSPSRECLRIVYRRVAECLREGRTFAGPSVRGTRGI